ncbi:TetR/AcrR family transcriptional regulator [Baekduia soli]|uniref:TetR/AcrR family transcriptional regulator n=1 Tax=Baekduia soli TaxID=496014 RepID=UPI001651E604|nr:TetR/AcrR family transcriptional regulator [Baekduia soli]
MSAAPTSTVRPDQKRFIRQEAAKLFARQGYHATGVEDISRAVGLGRGALYHHIGSKEQLLFEISRLGLDELFEDTEGVLADPELDAAGRLRAMSRVLMNNLYDNLAALTVYFREVDLMSPKYRRLLVRQRAGYEAIWRGVIADGVAAGEFAPVDPVIVKGMLGMHNYAYLWIRQNGRLSPDELADVFCTVLLDGLRGHRPRD